MPVKNTNTKQTSKSSGGGGAKTDINKKYQKLEHKEHVLLRPDSYVGSVEKHIDPIPVYDDELNVIQKQKITWVPALYKIYDEILVNAIDQTTRLKQRYYSLRSKKTQQRKLNVVNEININVNKETGVIEIKNNGKGIDIEFMDEHKMYPPELIFGVLLTGENYDDSEEREVGGKNGYGAKLANLFSTEFIVETVDDERKLKYYQVFSENMKKKTKPVIEEYNEYPFTRFKFHPDYKRFDMKGMDDSTYQLFKKRAWDTAAWVGKEVKVTFNGEEIKTNSFQSYSKMYIGDLKDYAHEKCNEKWEIIATYNSNEVFEQVSFVNGINTIRGGKHVDYIVKQIADKLIELMKKAPYKSRTQGINIKDTYVKNQLMVFVKSSIINPNFDGQTKETLTTVQKKFGSECEVSDNFIKDLAKTGIIDRILTQAEYKESKSLAGSDGKKVGTIRGIKKLDDANKAGSRESKKCTLILVEGDSAKTMVMAGLNSEQRDYFGVFPLKGKLLNVKETKLEKIANNDEICNLKKIIGLEANKNYDQDFAVWPLRYGRIMVLTDQDVDGSHIKGLILGWVHTLHPGLIENGFVCTMITPIVRVSKGKQDKCFYTENDYKIWKENTKNSSSWKTKYYKGLGTSGAKEAKEYFRDPKIQQFTWTKEKSAESIDLALNRNRADNRKSWIRGFDPDDTLNPLDMEVSIEDFFNKEFLTFSNYSVNRAIPHVMDGFKPSHRKIIYSCFKRNLVKEIKVAQLAGYVSENAGYHHGEASLHGTIIGLAQNYTGSNNINLLSPNGQFGSRRQNGKDFASPRYIFTQLAPLTKILFPDSDFQLLSYLEDDGSQIEPIHYTPILPMVLINGAEGIGTGWSTLIPTFNPMDIGKLLESKQCNKPAPEIRPWYNGFTGEILKVSVKKYLTKGVYKKLNNSKIQITELPIGTSIEDYKEFLETLLISAKKDLIKEKEKKTKGKNNKSKVGAKKTTPRKGNKKIDNCVLTSIRDLCTDTKILFELKFQNPIKLMRLEKEPLKERSNGVERLFKLTSSVNLSNMNLINIDGTVKKYNTPYEIMDDFYETRMKFYILRKKYLLEKLKRELELIDYKVKFIRENLAGTIDLRRKKKDIVYKMLETKSYPQLGNTSKEENENNKKSYDYLVKMPMDTVTYEKVEELEKKHKEKQAEYDTLFKKKEKALWVEDLRTFFKEYKKIYKITTPTSTPVKSGGGAK